MSAVIPTILILVIVFGLITKLGADSRRRAKNARIDPLLSAPDIESDSRLKRLSRTFGGVIALIAALATTVIVAVLLLVPVLRQIIRFED